VPERMIEANGVELCTEAFGDPSDPPILLVMGIGGSMLWWEEGFCRILADGRRFVTRYDHRDTGRSTAYEPGRPGYTGRDLVADAAGVLDAYGLPAAHVVGVSMGGALAQLLALDFADRVLSLVLVSTSRAVPGDRELPPPTEGFARFAATAAVDWSQAKSVIEYVVDYSRVLAGERPFDESAVRELSRRDVERARNFSAAQNHDLLADDEPTRAPLTSIAAPTLVIHGTADPMFPLGHGEALAEEIPRARLLALDGAGHGLERADWEVVAEAILEHTSPGTVG
jgi:pimeloyl-ACP methyl ester carboxylesterase